MSKNKRYQYQPWYVKLWRRRHYIPIPFVAIKIWWHERNREMRDEYDWSLTFGQSWGLATGLAQGSMNWTYDWTEVKSRIEAQLKTLNEKSYKITFFEGAGLVWVKVDSNPDWVGCGHNREEALVNLRESVEFCHGAFNIRDWWLSKKIRFSESGKL